MKKEVKIHSVQLDREKCVGCTNCVKRCPTEAIRVREGKARIIEDRCIDCGECIRVCKYHAKLPVVDNISDMENYKYKIALPAPALFGQFKNLGHPSTVIYGLLKLGFDDVFEVARAAECVSLATRKAEFFNSLPKPVISSACPAVVKLIRVRYPELIDNLLKLNAPIEVAARVAKTEAAAKYKVNPDKIGVFFISPCPAKMTAVHNPMGTTYSAVDHVLAIRDVYPLLVQAMDRSGVDDELISKAGRIGLSWGATGGEASALLRHNYLAADGIDNAIAVLDEIEDEKLSDLDFVELNACSGGCTGGVLTVTNPFMCITNIKELTRYMPITGIEPLEVPDSILRYDMPLLPLKVLQLNSDRRKALEMMQESKEIEERLYGMDCGACGAPSCKALAEDIVRGFASEDYCIYKMREGIMDATKILSEMSVKFPRVNPTGDREDDV